MTMLRSGSFAMTGLAAAALVVTGFAAAPAMAQSRSPAYAAARAAGQVGEQADGYLGVVGNQSADVKAMVRDINNQRRAVYTQGAAGKGTIEEFAFVSACRLISETKPGEKYQAPDGSWKTRGAGAPDRDPRCP
ncbi:YdbL family protein [Novosphingobium sp. 9]|uniref:YdbL family protein n=1 Tax=Novosphingobium sp. 9 TaxID=2025349 RepID=UPI0021B4DBA6|nr:YdbL family protein [Novosphingobium sp. 9]